MAWPMGNALSKVGWTGKPLLGVTPSLMDMGRGAKLMDGRWWTTDDESGERLRCLGLW